MPPNDPAENLTSRQWHAIAALLACTAGGRAADQQAAEVAGCHPRTVRRWRATEPFAAALRAESRRMASEATSALLAAQGEAVDALRAALWGGSPATRVRAARVILEAGQRVTDADIDQRLTDLERRLASWTDGQHGLRVLTS